MNTTVVDQTHPTARHHSPDVYDPDDVGPHSPMLQAYRPNFEPDRSPEPMINPERKGSWKKMRSNMGEGVVVHFMGNGAQQELSHSVAMEPLPQSYEFKEVMRGGVLVRVPIVDGEDEDGGDASDEREVVRMKDGDSPNGKHEGGEEKPAAHGARDQDDLAALAAKAVWQAKGGNSPKENGAKTLLSRCDAEVARVGNGEPMAVVKTSQHPAVTDDKRRPSLEIATMLSSQSPSSGALPPIQNSPSSVNGNQVTLPSIQTTLADIKLPPPDTPRDKSAFPQSPPPPQPPLFTVGSPGRSPNDPRALPSPGARNFYYAQPRRHSHADQMPYTSSVEYSSSNAETPSDKSTPSNGLGLARMSIDGLDNPQIGGYQCTHAGCTAPPFQTQVGTTIIIFLRMPINFEQYLLNSHANVHSQSRPHYCSVKGCPRSEAGKGFKRKNEMIRHGLVHASPGYVCPFCPDREHKYPRPDNLQR